MYNINLNNEYVGMNLSKGELNQWLIDLYRELDNSEQLSFLESFSCNNENFEEVIYDINITYPQIINFRNLSLIIEITE